MVNAETHLMGDADIIIKPSISSVVTSIILFARRPVLDVAVVVVFPFPDG